MLRQCFLKAGCQYGHTWLVTYLFLSFNSDSINIVCVSWNMKVFPKISRFGRDSAFFLVIFGKLLRACFIVLGPAKLKIIRVRSVLNDVSVPFASCLPNRQHSEYYSCQTVKSTFVLCNCICGRDHNENKVFSWPVLYYAIPATVFLDVVVTILS